MKKYILLVSLLYSTVQFAGGQVVSETVSIDSNYTKQVFYSMQNGAYPSVDNTNWDLAFQIRGFAGSIMINSRNNVHLYRAMKSIADWNTLTAADTTGLLNSNYELYNSDVTWDEGAFSGTYDTANAFDLGWGVYDFVTHAVNGDSIFFIQLSNGIYKKLAIESLTAGIYYFRWADLDGSNEVTASLDKTAFANKFFGYYSIVNAGIIDREPVYNTWDLTFTQYMALSPILYKVAGVLSNDSVFVAKAYPVDVNTVSHAGQNYMPEINTIGYNWKTFDFGSNSWLIEDSLVYFVQDRNEVIWKVIFTGFGGSANGNFEFTKEQVGTAGIAEESNRILSLYPNPAREYINLVIAANGAASANVKLFNATGQLVHAENITLGDPLNSIQLPVKELPAGLFHLMVESGNQFTTKSFVVN